MKYTNLSYLINHLNFGDELVLTSGKSYEVEQVHDHFLLDVYDDNSQLHTFDLRRLFINEKIKSINHNELPKFNKDILIKNGYKKIVSQSECYLPLSFSDLKVAVKYEKIYSPLFDMTCYEKDMSELNWQISHFIDVYFNVKNKDYTKLKQEYGDDVALILLSSDVMDEDGLQKDDKTLIFQGIDLTFIKKIYFINQLSLDRFLASIRNYEWHNFIKAKCVFDPYLLDETLLGKW